MKCIRPDLSEKLVLYIEHLLGADEQKEVESHIAECELCRDETQALCDNISLIKKSAASGLNLSLSSPCPDDRMLVEFSESPESLAPGDRKKVESHIESCQECQSILENLRELSGSIEHFQDVPDKRITMPEAMKAQISALYKREAREPEGLILNVIRFFQKPRYSFISALAALLLVVGAFTLMIGDMAGRHKSEVSVPSSTQALLTMRPDDESLRRELKVGGERSQAKEEASDSGASSPQKMAKSDTMGGATKQSAFDKGKETLGFTEGRKDITDSLKEQEKNSQSHTGSTLADKKKAAMETYQAVPSDRDNASHGAGAGGTAPGGPPIAEPGGAPVGAGYGTAGSGGGASGGAGGMMPRRTGAGLEGETNAPTDTTGNLIVGGSHNAQAQQYARTQGAMAPSSQNIKKENKDMAGTKTSTEGDKYASINENKGTSPAQPSATVAAAQASPAPPPSGKTLPAPVRAAQTSGQKAPAAPASSKPSMARIPGTVVQPANFRDSEKERIERELAAAGQSYLDRTLGSEKARITVMITPDEEKSSLEVKKISVVIKSTCTLKEKEKTSLVQGISEKLKLRSDRDTVHIEITPAK